MIKTFKDKNEERAFNNSVYNHFNTYLSRKKKHQECMYYGCTEKAINSHSISSGSSLTHISCDENNLRFLESRRNDFDKYYKFEPIGINEASTFKGFCNRHDRIFKSIDDFGVRNIKDIILQIYRCISHAVFCEGIINIKQINKTVEVHFESKKKNIFNQIEQEIGSMRTNDIEDLFMKEKNRADTKELERYERLCQYQEKIQCLIDNNIEDQEQMYNGVDFFNGDIFTLKDVDLYFSVYRMNYKVPVAVINNVYIDFDKPSDVIFNVIPSKEHTDILIIFSSQILNTIAPMWKKGILSDIAMLNMIESNMMNSEKWYINPEVVDKMNNQKRNIIEEDMFCIIERTLFQEYDISIFDELRFELIKYCDEETRVKELSKIYNLPERMNIEQRKEIAIEKLLKQRYEVRHT